MSALARTRRAVRAVALVYALRALAAWILASPLARALNSTVAAQHPRGDAILFDPGGLELIESLRLSLGVLGSELKGALLIGTVLGALSVIPAAALLAALVEDEPSGPAEWVRRAVTLFPRFVLSFGARLFLQGAVLAVGALALGRLGRRLASSWPEQSADLSVLGLGLLVLAAASALGIYEDLFRVESARGATLGRALRQAGALLRARWLALGGSWLCLVACALVLPLLVAPLVGIVDVSRPGSWRLVVVTFLHQGVVLGMVAARAVWLAIVIELGSAPRAQRLPIDLQVPPSGPIPAEVEAHDTPPQPGE